MALRRLLPARRGASARLKRSAQNTLNGLPWEVVLYLNRLKRQLASSMHSELHQGELGNALHAWLNLNTSTKQAMTKSLEVISEAIRNPKHPFRKVDNQPKKPLKHRYERRKIREYLNLGEWVSGEAT
jgi:hypothetical protein